MYERQILNADALADDFCQGIRINRLTYTFGKSDSREHNRHNHIDTGGYGEEHHH